MPLHNLRRDLCLLNSNLLYSRNVRFVMPFALFSPIHIDNSTIYKLLFLLLLLLRESNQIQIIIIEAYGEICFNPRKTPLINSKWFSSRNCHHHSTHISANLSLFLFFLLQLSSIWWKINFLSSLYFALHLMMHKMTIKKISSID